MRRSSAPSGRGVASVGQEKAAAGVRGRPRLDGPGLRPDTGREDDVCGRRRCSRVHSARHLPRMGRRQRRRSRLLPRGEPAGNAAGPGGEPEVARAGRTAGTDRRRVGAGAEAPPRHRVVHGCRRRVQNRAERSRRRDTRRLIEAGRRQPDHPGARGPRTGRGSQRCSAPALAQVGWSPAASESTTRARFGRGWWRRWARRPEIPPSSQNRAALCSRSWPSPEASNRRC